MTTLTEAEWLSCRDINNLLVRHFRSKRKGWLFPSACCRRIAAHFPDALCHRAVEAAEAYADGGLSDNELDGLHRQLRELVRAYPIPHEQPEGEVGLATAAAVHAALELTNNRYAPPYDHPEYWVVPAYCRDCVPESEQQAEGAAQATLYRDLIVNPFRPVTFAPAWSSDTVLSLARGMYESRDFAAMPILADALQDAGCDSDDVLAHCRDPHGVHVRGCWVVDGVLGKA